MKGVEDTHHEILNVQKQLSLLKSKRFKTEEDVKEIADLNRYYDCLILDCMSESH